MIFSFEDHYALLNIEAVNSNIRISKKHYKDGECSLKCDFFTDSYLDFNVDLGYVVPSFNSKDNRKAAFGMYVYNEVAQNEEILLEFFENDKLCCWFEFNINFIGWRSIFIRYDYDMQGVPTEKMNKMRINLKSTEATLFFDQIVTSNLFDPRSCVPSFQVPYIGANSKSKNIGFAKEYTAFKLYELISETNSNDDLDLYKELYRKVVLDTYENLNAEKQDILAEYNELNISISDDNIKGKPVEYRNQAEIYAKTEYEKQHNPIALDYYNKLMLKCAYLYHQTKDEELSLIFNNMLKHIIDQGLAEGSSMGVLHHIDYSMRLFYPAIFLMEKEIEKEGLIDRVIKICQWFSGFGTIFIDKYIQNRVTADTFNTLAQAYLIIALLMNNSKALKQLSSWLNMNMSPTEGLCGLMKTDGGIFHHCGHYTAYGMDGLTGVMPVIYTLSGSEYEINDFAWQTLSKVLLNMRFYVEKYDFPVSMSGRHPTGKWKINLIPFKYWALAGQKRGDELPVRVYKRLDYTRDFAKNINAEDTPNGHITMNSGCCAFHRRGEWLAAIKGFSKYVWGNETYIGANLYGRFMSYNHLEILENSQEESGFNQLGFDWASIPGSTTIHFPIDEMRSMVYNLDNCSGFEEMLLSDESFAGGVDDKECGIFAMKISGHPKYDKGHNAIVSTVFHNNFILCLGSNITNTNNNHETHTTIYQKAKNIEKHKYYYDDNKAVKISGVQKSQNQDGSGETIGFQELLYINHGVSPKNAEYEYSIGVNQAEKLDYTVLQKDSNAHIVKIENTTYYAIFEPGKFNGCGNLKSTSHMILLMENEKGIFVCQPDLGLYNYDKTQYDADGNRVEVSMYSREWITTPVMKYHLNLEFMNGKKISLVVNGGEVIKLI